MAVHGVGPQTQQSMQCTRPVRRPLPHERERRRQEPVRPTGRLRRRPPCRDFGETPVRGSWRRRCGPGGPRSRRCTGSSWPTSPSSTGPRRGGATVPSRWRRGSPSSCGSRRRRPLGSGWTAGGSGAVACLAASLASGELSLDKVAPLAEVASPETDAELRRRRRTGACRQARELLTWHKAQSEAQAAARAKAGVVVGEPGNSSIGRFASTTRGPRRCGWLSPGTSTHWPSRRPRRAVWVGVWTYAVGSVLVAAGRGGRRAGDGPAGASGHDGRLRAVRPAALRHPDRPVPAVRPGSSGRVCRLSGWCADQRRASCVPRLVVHAPLESAARDRRGRGRDRRASGPIPAEVARRLACDAQVTLRSRVAMDRILDQGRARRDPTTAQRIEIARRDKGCRVPGLPFTEFTDVHHMSTGRRVA